MLNVAMSYARSYQEAILGAIKLYNEIEGQKIYHERHVHKIEDAHENAQFMCEIWFTLRVIEQQPPKYEFVGSQGIDPTDPNWREKWEAANAVAQEATEQILSENN